MKYFNTVFFFLIIILFSNCTSQKKLSYFNKVNEGAADSINSKSDFGHEAKIKSGDVLVITVTGSDPNAVAVFNLPVIAYSTPGSENFYGVQTQQPYTVDVDGTINFPVLGKLKLQGLSRSEAVNLISGKLTEYVQNPIVNVKFLNFNVTVLGEVLRPGQYPISNERTTILDALGMAGDMTPYGRRENVLVTREHNGKLQFARLNLNEADVFTSPYYYIQQNDVIYVEPNSVRSISSQNIPLFLSSVSTLATLITLTYSISKNKQSANSYSNK